MIILVKSMEKRRGTRERGSTGLIKGTKKDECSVGVEKRIVNRDKKEITLMLIPTKSLGQIVKYVISEV